MWITGFLEHVRDADLARECERFGRVVCVENLLSRGILVTFATIPAAVLCVKEWNRASLPAPLLATQLKIAFTDPPPVQPRPASPLPLGSRTPPAPATSPPPMDMAGAGTQPSSQQPYEGHDWNRAWDAAHLNPSSAASAAPREWGARGRTSPQESEGRGRPRHGREAYDAHHAPPPAPPAPPHPHHHHHQPSHHPSQPPSQGGVHYPSAGRTEPSSYERREYSSHPEHYYHDSQSAGAGAGGQPASAPKASIPPPSGAAPATVSPASFHHRAQQPHPHHPPPPPLPASAAVVTGWGDDPRRNDSSPMAVSPPSPTRFSSFPLMWQGQLSIKTNSVPANLRLVSGSWALSPLLPPAPGPVKIAQRQKLSNIEPLLTALNYGADYYAVLLARPGLTDDHASAHAANFSNSLVSYLQEKQAAGFVQVAGGAVYLLPASEAATTILSRVAPQLDPTGAMEGNLLVFLLRSLPQN